MADYVSPDIASTGSADTSTDSADTTTRDLGTLTENGPILTAYETPSARAAYTDRPSFSPVAQPGMAPEIWYHTVPDQGQIANYAPPSNGMISRLNGSQQQITVDLGGGGGKRKKKRKKDDDDKRRHRRDK